MPDYFALLNEPRRPWLDPENLKSKFLALSAEVHPDRFHSAPEAERRAAHERFAESNTAYQVLREPKDRWLHLLELESGAKPADVRRIPTGTMDLSMEVGLLCRAVDSFLAERARVTSPMVKVQMFEHSQGWTDKLHGLLERIHKKKDELLAEALRMNRAWEGAAALAPLERTRALPLGRLEEMYRLASFLDRWTEQIRERRVALSC